ncbi:MAG: F0F1 ATP synthase subunit epsilon [Paracoccaceae bacterium]
MADMMQFDLVSPERRLASLEVTAVSIPGAEGDMTAMAGHMPTITTLRPGILRVEGASGTEEYVVSGGFAEINAAATSVLAEKAVARADVTKEFLDSLRQEAEAAHEAAEHHVKDATAKTLADLAHLAEAMV